MKKTLFDITNEALVIYENLEENGGELTPEIEQALVINEKELQSKGIAYVELIGFTESYVSRVDEEIKRLQAIKKRNTLLVDNLKNRLLDAQQTYGDFTLGFTTITTRKSESIEVEDVNSLPKEFKVIKVTESADKMALKKAIQDGQEIEGVCIVEHLNLKIS